MLSEDQKVAVKTWIESWSLLTQQCKQPSLTPFHPTTKQSTSFAWLQPRCMPLSKGVPQQLVSRAAWSHSLCHQPQRSSWASAQLSQQLFHINKSIKLIEFQIEVKYTYISDILLESCPTLCIVGNGLYFWLKCIHNQFIPTDMQLPQLSVLLGVYQLFSPSSLEYLQPEKSAFTCPCSTQHAHIRRALRG